MTQKQELEALRAEVAKLREDVAALTAAMVQLAVKTPYPVTYIPYAPQPMWPPVITWTSGDSLPPNPTITYLNRGMQAANQ